MPTQTKLVPLMMVTVALIWGGCFIAGRHLATEVAPALTAFLRFFIACIVLYFFSQPTKQQMQIIIKEQLWIRILLMGLSGVFLYNICFFYGFQDISASRGSLIVALNPAIIGLASFLFLKENLGYIRWLGIAISLVGVTIIILSKDPQALSMNAEAWKGDLLLLCCVASWAIYSLVAKPVITAIGATSAVLYSLIVGTLFLGLFALISQDLTLDNIQNIGLKEWSILFFLGGLGSSLAFVLYYMSINIIGATMAGVYIALVPIFGVTLGALLLNEEITLAIIIGGSAATFGVILSNFNGKKP
ncbi:MAG TPA: DMT family transporter [Thiotrichaceae bacterium]|nr:DMT family transporter [Thiotrichaceae bacterium]